jgi:tetratricopeptide (TPR) repeat protein
LLPPLVPLLLLLQPPAAEAYRQAVSLYEQGRAEQAIPLLERAVQLEPKNAQYWKTLGVAHARLEDYRGSLEPFRQACLLDERLPDACYYAGRAFYASDQYEKALEPLSKALRVDPVKGRAEAALGQCHEALGQPAEAEKRLRAAVARNDSAAQLARLAYSRFLTRQGRAPEAVPVAEKAQQPETPQSRFELALALSQSGRLEDALKALDRALTLQPDYEEAFVLRAKLQARLKALQP